MHRLSNQTYVYIVKTRPLLLMLISPGYSNFCVCLVTNGAKDGIFGALRLVSCFKGPYLIPQHHLVDIDSYIFYLSICASFNPNSQHICRGSNCYHMGFMKLFHILLHMVNMLGQATWVQLNFISYLCTRVVINYQNGGD